MDVERISPHWLWDGTAWAAQQTGFEAIVAPHPLGVAALGQRLHLVLRGKDGQLSWYFTQDGRWAHGGQLGAAGCEASLIAVGDQLVMFTTINGHLMYRTYHDDVSVRELRAPISRTPIH